MDHIIDATDQRLGRLASKIAVLLQGKTHPDYAPKKEGNDRVRVTNTAKISVSGQKGIQKMYHHHTGYMGHLRSQSHRQMVEKSPANVLRRAVYNMLPKNTLRAKRLRKLVIE